MGKKRATEKDLKNWGLVWDEKSQMYVKRSDADAVKDTIKAVPVSGKLNLVEGPWRLGIDGYPVVTDEHMRLLIKFDVNPIGKPRMTVSDKWKKRDATGRYWVFKDQLRNIAKGHNFKMPESDIHMLFNIEMPQSWPKKKKEEMDGKPHLSKPDGDNILKAVQDSLCDNDSYIWDVRITKKWAYKGSIKIYSIK